jgi:hypothetical protein
MVRFTGLGLWLLICGLFLRTAAAVDVPEKKAAELNWAKGVAEDFLEAAFAGKTEQAQSLIDGTLKSAFAKEGEHRLSEWLNNSIAIRGFQSPVMQQEAISPDQDEASFKGSFQADKTVMQFSLRVSKDKENGKWRMSYFQFAPQVEKK